MTTDQEFAPHVSVATAGTMRAAVQRRYAGPEQIALESVARPTLKPREVLIEVLSLIHI